MPRDIHTDEGELVIVGGDFVVDDASEQHLRDLLLIQKGELKQHPLTGVGIRNYMHAPLSATARLALEREIRLQLEADGARNVAMRITAAGMIEITRAEWP